MKNTSVLVQNRLFFDRLTLTEPPLGVQRRNVPHFKGLIMLYLDFEAQERDSSFTLHHAHLKKAVLHQKMAIGPLLLLVCVLAPGHSGFLAF